MLFEILDKYDLFLIIKKMLIRIASISDAHGIASVHVDSWRSAYIGIIPDKYLKAISIHERERRWNSILSMEGSKTYIAELNNRIVAFMNFGSHRRILSLNHGEIYAIYAVREIWGRGVGHALMKKAISYMVDEECSKISVNVLLRNVRGMNFYKKHGFSIVAESARSLTIGSAILQEVEMILNISK